MTLISTVTDAETPTSSLTTTWSGPGSFSASEPITIWRLPATVSPTPSPVTATLTVTETYVEGAVTHKNVTTAPFVMQVHDSQKEILDLGEDFLTLFSQSQISSTDVLHNFSTACDRGDGYRSEKSDTDANRTYLREDFSKFTVARADAGHRELRRAMPVSRAACRCLFTVPGALGGDLHQGRGQSQSRRPRDHQRNRLRHRGAREQPLAAVSQ